MNTKQEKILGLKPGWLSAIRKAKEALRDLDRHGVGIFASGLVEFRPAKAMDPRLCLGEISMHCDGGDGGDTFAEFDDIVRQVEEAEECG